MWKSVAFAAVLLVGMAIAAPSTTKATAKGPAKPKQAAASTGVWPKENFAMLMPAGGCPEETWPTGIVKYTLERGSTVPDFLNASVVGQYLTLNFCTHKKSQSGASAPKNFPKGSYCLNEFGHEPHKLLTQNCPKDFKWSWLAIDTVNLRNMDEHSGSLGLGEFFSFSTVHYFCCRDDGDVSKEIVLPATRDFVMLPSMTSGKCQKVKGMTETKTEIYYKTEDIDASFNGAPGAPDFPPPEYKVDEKKDFWGKGLHLSICTYASKSAKKVAKQPAAVEAPVCWPKENFYLHQPKDGCPEGASWKSGSVNQWEKEGSKIPESGALNASVNGQLVTVGYCDHTAAAQAKQTECTDKATAKFEPGSYCVFQGKISSTGIFDKSCPKGFVYSWFVIDDVNEGNKNDETGEAPEGEYYDYATCLYACCRADGDPDLPINLPNKKPFVLMPNEIDRKCQKVNGMEATYEEIFYNSEDGDADVIPQPKGPTIAIDYKIDAPKGKWGAGMHVKVCSYKPT